MVQSATVQSSDPEFGVLQIVGDGNAGGATTIVLELVSNLQRAGIAVALASNRGSYIIEEARSLGVPVVEFDFTGRLKTAAIGAALVQYLRSRSNTIIHAHGCRAGLPAAAAAAVQQSPLVYTVHGFHFLGKAAGVRHLAKAAERYTIRRAKVAVFVSQHDADVAREYRLVGRQGSSQIIRNGSMSAQIDARRRPQAEFDIAFLGRLAAVKNVMLLPQILAALRPATPRLCVIGGGECEDELRREVVRLGMTDQVTFVGPLRHADALAYLSRSRVMVLPSKWEGLPVSVIEAMHLGVPVVASSVGGTPEVVVDGQTGYLVAVNDILGYALRLKQILSDDGLYDSLSGQAVTRARREFSLERQLAEYREVYQRLAVRRSPSRFGRLRQSLLAKSVDTLNSLENWSPPHV